MLERIANIICQYVETDPAAITENTALRSELGATSLDLANIIVAVEEEFSISISDRDILAFQTVGDLINFIQATVG